MKREQLSGYSARYSWFLQLHFLICSAVLVKAATIVAWNVYSQLPIAAVAATFNEFFAEFSYWPKKPAELLTYVFSIASLAVYYAAALYVITQASLRSEPLTAKITKTTLGVAVYFVILLAVNVLLFWLLKVEISGFMLTVGLILWLAFLVAPIAGFVYARLDYLISRVSPAVQKFVPLALVTLATLQIITIFTPYIVGTLNVPNDYMDISEQTRLGNHYVDNTDYINTHRIAGLIKYSPDRDQGKTPKPLPGSYIALKKTTSLVDFIQQHETFPIITVIQNRKLPLELTDFYLKSSKSRETRYYYNDELGALVLHGRMTRQEKQELEGIVSDNERPRVNTLFFKAAEYETFYAKRGYTTEESEFLRNNRDEFAAQAKAGWFFHHHSQMFTPISEYALGKPAAEINAQYGKTSALTLKYLSELIGGINFQNYFKTLYSFFPLYLVLALLALIVIFRDIGYVLLGVLLIYGSFLLIGEQLLFIAPGFNPIRHFFDLPTIIALHLYLNRRQHIFLLMALSFGVLTIVMSTEFGLALMGALLLVIGLRLFARQDRRPRAEIVSTILGAVAAMIVTISSFSNNPMLIYYLLGVSAPSIEPIRLLFILGAVSFLYLFAINIWSIAGPKKYLFLFLFLYTQGSVIYFVWNPGIHHLLALSPIWVLMLLTMFKIVFENYDLDKYRKVVMLVATMFVATLVYFPALGWYYLSRAEAKASFNSHKIYTWNFPTAKFRSTMDPSYFAKSVDLIKKYAPENAIYIISKYDNFLPFLAQKYSAMPFIQVSTSLVSQKEIDQCTNTILNAHPRYLFVDSDIERNLNGDIFHELDPVTRMWGLYSESFSRVKVLNLQRRIYDDIKDKYEPIEKGVLITVYKYRG